jgi:Leucine-rich repeat (LRR) protein
MEGLSTLVALEELYVGRNKLSTLGGLEGLTNLRILSIQSNRITQLAGLEVRALRRYSKLNMTRRGDAQCNHHNGALSTKRRPRRRNHTPLSPAGGPTALH